MRLNSRDAVLFGQQPNEANRLGEIDDERIVSRATEARIFEPEQDLRDARSKLAAWVSAGSGRYGGRSKTDNRTPIISLRHSLRMASIVSRRKRVRPIDVAAVGTGPIKGGQELVHQVTVARFHVDELEARRARHLGCDDIGVDQPCDVVVVQQHAIVIRASMPKRPVEQRVMVGNPRLQACPCGLAGRSDRSA